MPPSILRGIIMKQYTMTAIGLVALGAAIHFAKDDPVEVPPLVIKYKHELPVEPEVEVEPELEIGMVYDAGRAVSYSEKEINCLATNIFYEAGVEDFAGKIAVAQVTNNRLKQGRWGDDLCQVVYSRKQFSWTLSSKLRYSKPSGPLWEDSIRAAYAFISGYRVYGLDTADHYHADYVKRLPKFAIKGEQIVQIGTHIFYHKVP